MALVQIEASKLITVVEDHGGCKSGRCIECGKIGWLPLEHKPGCAVSAALESEKQSAMLKANSDATAALPCHGSGAPSRVEPDTMFERFDPECIPGS